jgi:EAL domain-containing protein (putative c-di-GMP-specific phosphodiesterase class I)
LVSGAVEEAGIQPDLLDLELNESLVMRDLDEAAPRLTKLRALGLRVALDDFGAGYASLGHLQRLPIDSLKINQSFVRELGAGSQTPLLVGSMVALAQGLGIRVTAGGVETQTQLSALRTTGCDRAQGYLLGRPLPAEELLPSILRIPQGGLPPLPYPIPQPANAPAFELATR